MYKNRIISLLLSLLLVGCSIVSCGSNEPSAETETAAETLPEMQPETTYPDTLGFQTFDGFTFKTLVALDNPAGQCVMPDETVLGNAVNDAYIERDYYVESTYDIELTYDAFTPANAGATTLIASVMAGDSTYHMAIGPLKGGALDKVAADNCLYNLLELPYLSMGTSPWWSKLMCESLTLNNKQFFAAGDLAIKMFRSVSAMYANLNLLAQNGVMENPTDLYQYVREGTWTLDKLYNFSKDGTIDVNGDAKYDAQTDIFGLAGENYSLMTDAYAVGAGISLSSVDENGNLEVNLNHERTLAVIEKMRQLIVDITRPGDYKAAYMFAENRALFFTHFIGASILYFRDMEADYAFLPLPKYDESQDTYRSLVNAWDDAFIAVPKLCGNPDMVGYIAEILAYESYQRIRPAMYEITLKKQVSRDPDSAEMLDIIIGAVYLDFNAIYGFGGSTEVLAEAILKDSEFVSKIEAKEKMIAAAVAECSSMYQ